VLRLRGLRATIGAVMLAVLSVALLPPIPMFCAPGQSVVAAASHAGGHMAHGRMAHHGAPERPADRSPMHDVDCLRHCVGAPSIALPSIEVSVVAVIEAPVPPFVAPRALAIPDAPDRLLPFANGPPLAVAARA
jgi:hypothetical protein